MSFYDFFEKIEVIRKTLFLCKLYCLKGFNVKEDPFFHVVESKLLNNISKLTEYPEILLK